jgi:hypothetical protein
MSILFGRLKLARDSPAREVITSASIQYSLECRHGSRARPAARLAVRADKINVTPQIENGSSLAARVEHLVKFRTAHGRECCAARR